MCRHGPCSLIRNGFLQYTTAEITLLVLRIKGCPAVLRLSLSLSSCSRSAVLVSSGLSPPAMPVPHAAQRTSLYLASCPTQEDSLE